MPCVEKVSGAIGDGLSMMWIVSFPIWGGMIFMGDIFSFMNNISYSLNKSSISVRLCPKSGCFFHHQDGTWINEIPKFQGIP